MGLDAQRNQNRNTRRVESTDISRRGWNDGEQIQETIQEHEGAETDLKGEGAHDDPIEKRFNQPDGGCQQESE